MQHLSLDVRRNLQVVYSTEKRQDHELRDSIGLVNSPDGLELVTSSSIIYHINNQLTYLPPPPFQKLK